MTIRPYLIPALRLLDPVVRVPKYLKNRYGITPLSGLENAAWAVDAYLFERYFITIIDLDGTQDASLSAQSDVFKLPENLDGSVPNATVRSTIETAFEAALLPGDWVAVGMGYRSLVRIFRGLCQYRNRIITIGSPDTAFKPLQLGQTISQTDAAVQTALQNAKDSINATEGLSIDFSSVTGTTTIRSLLYLAAQEYATIPFTVSGAGLSLTF